MFCKQHFHCCFGLAWLEGFLSMKLLSQAKATVGNVAFTTLAITAWNWCFNEQTRLKQFTNIVALDYNELMSVSMSIVDLYSA